MNEQEFSDLQELSAKILSARNSSFQPEVIVNAFCDPLPGEMALTMKTWIELERIRSPFLKGKLPESEEEYDRTFALFGLDQDDMSPEAAAGFINRLLSACALAFATVLKMEPNKEAGAEGSDDGFGDWLPLYACLVTQCGLSAFEALALRVDQAFALVAGMRRNQGWRVMGTPYALRGIAQTPEEAAP